MATAPIDSAAAHATAQSVADFADVTLPESWAENRWQASFAELRAKAGIP